MWSGLSRRRRTSRGFTLLELVVVIVIIGVIAGIGVVSYSSITRNAKDSQAKSLLAAIAGSQQSWYRSRNSFVVPTDYSVSGATQGGTNNHTLSDPSVQSLLHHIAPGTGDSRTVYVSASQGATAFGQVSLGQRATTGNVMLLSLATVSSSGSCFGEVVAPDGSNIKDFGPTQIPTLNGACDAYAAEAASGNQSGTGTSSSTAPNPPTHVTLTPGPGKLIVSWTASASDGTNDPTSYILTHSDGTPVATIDPSVTSYVDADASDPTKSYGYLLAARNAAGTSGTVATVPGNASPLSAATTIPAAPTGFTALWSGTSVRLSWAASSNAVGYQISRDGKTIACIGQTTCTAAVMQANLSNQYDDPYPGVQLGAAYTYRLQAINQLGNSAWTTLSFTTPPAAPAQVQAVAVPGVGDARCDSPSCVQVSWTTPQLASVDGVTTDAPLLGYRVYRCTTASCNPAANPTSAVLAGSVDAGTTSFIDKTQPGGTSLWYTVLAFNKNTQASTNAATPVQVATLPGAPTLTAAAGPNGDIQLSWKAPTSVQTLTGYDVFRVNADSSTTKIATTTTSGTTLATSYDDTGSDLPAGTLSGFTAYTYRVAAVTAAGDGTASADQSAVTSATPATGLKTSSDATSVTLTWNRAANVTYTITRGANTWNTPVGHFIETGLTPGTAYTYVITANATDPVSGAVTHVSTGNIVVTTAPIAPTALAATASGTSVTLTWTAPNPSGALTGYELFRCAGAGCTPISVATTSTSTSYTDSALVANTSYTYQVRALVGSVPGALSSPVSVATIPAAVVLTATAGAAGATLNWTASATATSYSIYRNGSWLTSVPGNLTSFTDGSLTGATGYSYSVGAKNSAGEVGSNTVTVTANPDPPQGLTATAGGSKITLTWLASGADGYQLWRCTGQGCDPTAGTATLITTLVSPSTLTYTDTGLAGETWYSYALTSGRKNADSTFTWSPRSTPVQAKTTLDPPAGVSVRSKADGSITVTWNAVSGAAGYNIYRNSAASPVGSTTGNGTTSWTDTNITPGSQYSYQITATAANGEESGLSAPATVTVPLLAPTNVTVTGTTVTSISLSWTASPGASTYDVIGCPSGCSTPGVYVSRTSATTATVTGLAANSSYDLYLIAHSTYADSGPSAHVTGWTAPGQPVTPSISNITASGMTMNWPAVPNASKYTIYRSGVQIGTVTAPTTSYRDIQGANLLSPNLSSFDPATSGVQNHIGCINAGLTYNNTDVPGKWVVQDSVAANTGNYCDRSGYFESVTSLPAGYNGQVTYSMKALYPAGSSGGQVMPQLEWYNIYGGLISVTAGTPVSPATSAPSTANVVYTATPPTGAVTVAIRFAITANASATSVDLYDQQLELGSSATPWVLGLGPGSSYPLTYTVTAPGGTSVQSPADRVFGGDHTLNPMTPTLVGAPGYEQATLNWTGVAGVLTWEVWRCIGAGCDPTTGTKTLLGFGAAPNYTDTGLADNTTYRYEVRGTNLDGTSGFSAPVTILTGPGAVTGVTASTVAGGTFSSSNLLDQGAPGATGLPAGWGSLKADSSDTADVAAGTAWSDTAAHWVWTGPGTAGGSLPAGTTYQSAPFTAAAAGKYLISWDCSGTCALTVDGATAVPAGTYAASTFHTAALTLTAGTHWISAADTNPAAGSAGLIVSVRRGSFTGPVVLSSATGWKATTCQACAAVPADRLAEKPSSINLIWTATPGAASYSIYRDGSGTALATGITGTSWADTTGLGAGTDHTYTITAINSAGTTGAASTGASTTAISDPALLSVSSVGDTSATITLAGPSGQDVTSFAVLLNGTNVATVSGSSGNYTFTGLSPQTAYTLAAQARTPAGTAADTTAVPVTTTVARPINLHTTGSSTTSISLSWNAVPGATKYSVTRNGAAASAACVNITGTSCTDTGLSAGTLYMYTVTAYDASTQSPQSNQILAATISSAPASASATATGTAATITWTAPVTGSPSAVLSYNIYRNGGASPVGTATGTSWTDPAAGSAGAQVSYTVTAVTAAGESPASNSTSVYLVPAALAAPVVTAASGSTNLSVAFSLPAGVSSVKIYRCVTSSCAPAGDGSNQVGQSSTSPYTDTTTTGGTQYWYVLVAVNAAGSSTPSPTGTAVAAPPAPALSGTAAPTSVTLTVTPLSSGLVTGYHLYRGATLIATIPAGGQYTYTDSGLNQNSFYSYTAAAYYSSGPDGPVTTPPVTGYTPLAAPTGLTVTGVTGTSVSLSWTAIPAAAGYKLTAAGVDSGTKSTVTISGGSSSTSTVTGLVAGTSYSFTLVAAGNGPDSPPSSAVVGTTTLGTPASLTANGGNKQVALSWPAVTGASGYTVYRCAGTCTPSAANSVAVGITVPNYTDANLANGTSYSYTVAATTTDVTGAMSPTATASTLAAAPTGLTASAAPTGAQTTAPQVVLTWNATPGASSYTLYRNGVSYRSGLTGTTYTDTGVSFGTSYSYTLTASNAAGESAQTAPVPAMTVPAQPVVTATGGYRQVTLTWPAVTGATSYAVYQCTGTSCTPTSPAAYTGAATTYTATGLADNATYRFIVGAVDASGENQASVLSSLTYAGIPANFTVTATTTTATFSWSASAGAANYILSGNGSQYSTAATSYTVTGLSPNTTYSFTIGAVNGSGNGQASAPITAITLPSPVTGIAIPAQTLTATSATITWSANSAGSSYKVYTCTGATNCTPSPAATATVTATNYTLTGLTAGTTVCASIAVVSTNTGVSSDQTGTVVCAKSAPNAPASLALSTTHVNADITPTSAFSTVTNGSTPWNVPYSITADNNGNVYVADENNNVVRQITPAGAVNVVAGTGGAASGSTCPTGPATGTGLGQVADVEFDSSGDMFIDDYGKACILMIKAGTSTLTAVAGTGTLGGTALSTTPVSATTVSLGRVTAMSMGADGNLYLSDFSMNAVYKITSPAGAAKISRVAGTGSSTTGYSGDSGPATTATLNHPRNVLADSTGNLYISDAGNHVVRKVSGGTISTIIGIPAGGAGTGDGGPAAAATLGQPAGLSFTPTGDLLVADFINNNIRRVNLTTGIISTVVGTGLAGESGANGSAAGSAAINGPLATTFDTAGNLWFVDYGSNTVHKVVPTPSATVTATWAAPTSGPVPASYSLTLTQVTGNSSLTPAWCTATTATSCTIPYLATGADLSISVSDTDGYATSAPATKTISSAADVSGLSTAASGQNVTLTWTPTNVNATYTVSRGGTTLATGLTTGSYTDAAPATGTTYTYTVTAVNSDGTSASGSTSATTVPGTPAAGPTVTVTSNRDVVTFASMPGALTYQVGRDDSDGSGIQWYGIGLAAGASWTDTVPFLNGPTHKYYYRAVNAAGISAASPATATTANYLTTLTTDGPDLFYRLNENGGTAIDYSGNGRSTAYNSSVTGTTYQRAGSTSDGDTALQWGNNYPSNTNAGLKYTGPGLNYGTGDRTIEVTAAEPTTGVPNYQIMWTQGGNTSAPDNLWMGHAGEGGGAAWDQPSYVMPNGNYGWETIHNEGTVTATKTTTGSTAEPWGVPTSDGTGAVSSGTAWASSSSAWMWSGSGTQNSYPAGTVYLRYLVNVPIASQEYALEVSCANSCSVEVDGNASFGNGRGGTTLSNSGANGTASKFSAVRWSPSVGQHLITIQATNAAAGPAGVLFYLGNSGGYSGGATVNSGAAGWLDSTTARYNPDPNTMYVNDFGLFTMPSGFAHVENWHQYDLVLSSASGSQRALLYVDGQPSPTGWLTATTTVNTSTSAMTLAGNNNAGAPWGGWAGPMDEFSIYPRALTQTQIADHLAVK